MHVNCGFYEYLVDHDKVPPYASIDRHIEKGSVFVCFCKIIDNSQSIFST